MGEDQLLDLILSRTKNDHYLKDNAVACSIFSLFLFKYLQYFLFLPALFLIFDRKQLKLVAYLFSNNQNKVAKSKIVWRYLKQGPT